MIIIIWVSLKHTELSEQCMNWHIYLSQWTIIIDILNIEYLICI